MNNLSQKTAIFSKDKAYRYVLTRMWDLKAPKVMWVLLNPSSADDHQDDPTIRRCISFSKKFGFGGMYVLNLFAYISTYPEKLLLVNDPIGPDNNFYLKSYASISKTIICGWGHTVMTKNLLSQYPNYKPLLGETTLCLTPNNNASHPLYLPNTSTLHSFKLQY